ncbi:CDP-glucose 4,6-dehydratase [Paraburkholderia mimosarum]|uniref:CDP-glucose 4,6-dehydratase n=1 Tax=Paraburkholderia mimosarum TaxID=312026 RepID=UPI0039C053FA
MAVNPTFWRDKKVFVTGHTGFKGSWLCLWLQRLGAQVSGYALAAPTTPSLFEVAHVARGMRSTIGDVRDAAALTTAMRDTAPEIVIHMAAQPLVRQSYADPVETYSTNVMGTVHLLEAVRKTPTVRAVVNVTSDKCYENREWVWGYREDEQMGGYDPYSSSKGCSELVTAAYRNSFFSASNDGSPRVALASARAGNVIGGGDWACDRLIPDILRALDAGESVAIRNPRSVRPWQHVLEPLSGYLQLAQRLYEHGDQYTGAWNFGPRDDDARPVQWILERFIERWGAGARWHSDNETHPHEAHHLRLDCSKAAAYLDWRPRWDLGTALDAIIAWQRAYLAGNDMQAVTFGQIDQFMLQESV